MFQAGLAHELEREACSNPIAPDTSMLSGQRKDGKRGTEKGVRLQMLYYFSLGEARRNFPTYWLTARPLPMFNREAIQPFGT